ncbi:MAG: tRNA (adenosine(37)-N6)-threonylcarbamoyltransferase complex ATPase subunit type 1 TsaE [Caldilineaceae bacterium]|nr:tRNA (adenosine(37)-N6)-threonylcarbamoyltransferase complex ATPase subunit type 1 TsaE [Caldilineaceae bacterium]
MTHPAASAQSAPSAQAHWQTITHHPAETEALGRRIGQAIRANLFIALSGDLGAGKTTFTKGLAAGLGLSATVTSPTFTLVNEYRQERGFQARRLVHADVYRLEGGSAAELDGIGYGDLLDDLEADESFGLLVLVVEWADRLGSLLPAQRLAITSRLDEEAADFRIFALHAFGPNATALLQELAQEQV